MVFTWISIPLGLMGWGGIGPYQFRNQYTTNNDTI